METKGDYFQLEYMKFQISQIFCLFKIMDYIYRISVIYIILILKYSKLIFHIFKF